MKYNRIEARFTAPDPELAEEMIADIFFDFDLKGVVCDVPLSEPDEGFGTDTLKKPEHPAVIGYIPAFDAARITLGAISQRLEELKRFGIEITVSTRTVDEKEWADAWKAYFHVVQITDRIVIRPEWRSFDPEPGQVVIRLDPGMAFGTGTHPTTAMCLELMDRYLAPGGSFLDVGTGSGILMACAAGLGARKMTGIDTDPVAVAVARENLEKNQVDPACYRLDCTTLDQVHPGPFDFICANIIAQVIVQILPDIALRMGPGSKALLSGIITEHQAAVMEAVKKAGLECCEEIRQDEWLALAVTKSRS